MEQATKIWIVLSLFLIIGFIEAIASEDIDEVCDSDNMTLFRYNGEWQCGSLENVIWTNIINETYIYNNYTSIANDSIHLGGQLPSYYLDDTVLSEAQVDSYCDNNGYLTTETDSLAYNGTLAYNSSLSEYRKLINNLFEDDVVIKDDSISYETINTSFKNIIVGPNIIFLNDDVIPNPLPSGVIEENGHFVIFLNGSAQGEIRAITNSGNMGDDYIRLNDTTGIAIGDRVTIYVKSEGVANLDVEGGINANGTSTFYGDLVANKTVYLPYTLYPLVHYTQGLKFHNYFQTIDFNSNDIINVNGLSMGGGLTVGNLEVYESGTKLLLGGPINYTGISFNDISTYSSNNVNYYYAMHLIDGVGGTVVNDWGIKVEDVTGGTSTNTAIETGVGRHLFGDDIETEGALALGGNTLGGLSNGDLNASTIYYDTLTAKSPIVMCSEGSNKCFVVDIEEEKEYYINIDEDFNILSFENKLDKADKSELPKKITDKFEKLKDKRINDNLLKEEKSNCGFSWDGECFEIVLENKTYKEATEKFFE